MTERDERTPPKRIRVTGLQEAQMGAVVELDAACAAMYYELGFDGAEVPRRSAADLMALARGNRIHVAEADYVVAGYLAWHDEAPGVAYLAELSVHPDYQRFGVAGTLFDQLEAGARELRLHEVVVRCWEKASWAMGFYRSRGFAPIGASAPAKVLEWRKEHEVGRPLTRPGEVALWAAVSAAPPAPVEEDDEEQAPGDGEA
jgi:N-acetylglutamate synthase-like GNAT family acetyltransferase